MEWSEWAIPVAFVQAGGLIDAEPIADELLPDVPGVPASGSAVIIDLPGAEAVYAGLSLAARGFRPVPLFNGTSGPSAVIDVSEITRALAGGASRIPHHTLARDAPPAFLLDARRSGGSVDLQSGAYDNRWVVLPQDFPSGALIASRGIHTTTLVQTGGG